jgi:hypothetical protein
MIVNSSRSVSGSLPEELHVKPVTRFPFTSGAPDAGLAACVAELIVGR